MEKFITGVVLVLFSHQIVTIYTYLSLLEEDGKIRLPHPPKPITFIIDYLLYGPMFGNFIYDISFGLVDHFRSKRLCKMIVDCNDEIERLKKEVDHQKELVDGYRKHVNFLQEMYNLDDYGFPKRNDYSSYPSPSTSPIASAAPEAPSSANTKSCPWSSAPASSAEYDTYKKEIQKSVSFESVCGKTNPYTGFKIKTTEDYQLYCDFLIQERIFEAKLSQANERISELEAELSTFRKQNIAQPESPPSSYFAIQNNAPAPKPISRERGTRERKTANVKVRDRFLTIYGVFLLLFFVVLYIVFKSYEG